MPGSNELVIVQLDPKWELKYGNRQYAVVALIFKTDNQLNATIERVITMQDVYDKFVEEVTKP